MIEVKREKRSNGSHLSEDETAQLRADIRSGLRASFLAKKYNIAERTVHVQKAKMEGTHGTKKKGDAWRVIKPKQKLACAQTPSAKTGSESGFIAAIPRSRLMGGRA